MLATSDERSKAKLDPTRRELGGQGFPPTRGYTVKLTVMGFVNSPRPTNFRFFKDQ